MMRYTGAVVIDSLQIITATGADLTHWLVSITSHQVRCNKFVEIIILYRAEGGAVYLGRKF